MHINERLLVNFCRYSGDAGATLLLIFLHYTKYSSEFKCVTCSLRAKVFFSSQECVTITETYGFKGSGRVCLPLPLRLSCFCHCPITPI